MLPRFQRSLIRCMKYNYEYQYVPRKQLLLEDTYSRAPLKRSIVAQNNDYGAEVLGVAALSKL